MPTQYTVRVASPVQYEYWEATSDTFEELLAAEQELRELKDQGGGETAQAVATVKKAFGNTTTQPATSSFGQKAGGGGATTGFGKGQQAQQELPDEVKLGEHEGYKVTLNVKGQWAKFGPNVAGYNFETKDRLKPANLPKGMSPDQVDLETAIALLAEKN